MDLKRLVGKRNEFGYTQTDMAKLLNISKSAYVFKEQGKTQFTVHELELLAGYLNCNTNFFAKPITKKV